MSERPCTIDGCDRPVRARGWCARHYQRWQRTGDPTKLLGRDNIRRRDSWAHGSRRGYELGCRCFPCRIAENRYQRAWAATGGVRVPVAQVLTHVEQLVASGWTRRAIADEANLGKSTLWHLASGRQQTVNSRTAAAIFALEPVRGPLTIDARPLVEAIERRRVRIAGVLDAADARAYYRARQTGTLTDAAADRIAVRALGLTLTEIYGDAEPLDQVLSGVADLLRRRGVTLDQLRARDRDLDLSHTRQDLALLLRSNGWTLTAIGQLLHRDHTTVLRAIRRAEAREDGPATCAHPQCDLEGLGGGRHCLKHFQEHAATRRPA